MDQYLEDYDGPVVSERSPTETSRMCEGIVRAFLGNKASLARVRAEDTGVETEKLYKALWGICQKNDYKGLVEVHKQSGTILLLRRR